MTFERDRTLAILKAARDGRYGILAQVVYDAHCAVGLVRAAERTRSPALLLIFPATLKYGGRAFLKYLLDLAHSASVPIAVHLDHATTAEDIDAALSLAESGVAFDSIMIDASHADTDEANMAEAKPHIARATAAGVPVEVELGRLEGGEAGLRTISDAQLTNPAVAEEFMKQTGAMILAPSIGNLHGRYLKAPDFRIDILKQLDGITRDKGHFLCLHGTDDLPDSLFRECIEAGVTKINVNSWGRDPYLARFAKGIQEQEPLPDTIEAATEVFAGECERFMRLFGSAGKADRA